MSESSGGTKIDGTGHSHPVVLFDGVCNLCNFAVQWILRRERDRVIRFAPLQSEVASRLLGSAATVEGEAASLVFVDEDGREFRQSDAVLEICRHLRAPWRWLRMLRCVPRPVRDAVYRFVARHRYRWFGRRASCMVPTPEVRERFLTR